MTVTPMEQTVLLVGGTGRTGKRVLEQLLGRGVRVRAIVRSASRLPVGAADDPRLSFVEADLLTLSDAQLQDHLRGCDTVISCLGHTISLKGVFGSPRDLVTEATTRLSRAIQTLQPAAPVRFILMSTVSVNHPGGREARRGMLERATLGLIRALVPPARDNQRAADFLHDSVGTADPFVRWAAVRPDTLKDGEVSGYALHEGLVDSLFAPGATAMSNVAHFMCELTSDPAVWDDWAGKLPVIVNVDDPKH